MSAGEEKAKGKRGGLRRTSWKPGCPSPNPGGRPRSSYRAAEAVRELVDPAEWIGAELAIARDPEQSTDKRMAAWHALIDRGFCKPPTDLNVNGGNTEPEPDLCRFTEDELRVWLALHEKATAGADLRLPEPSVPVDDAARDTGEGTRQ